LWGTLLLDYDNEDESKTSLSPRVISEVLGISEWDGQGKLPSLSLSSAIWLAEITMIPVLGRANHYQNGFLIVTHTGMTYYCSALSPDDRSEWILHVKRALECNFANADIVPFKPSKIIQSRPPPANNTMCPRTKAQLNSNYHTCNSCGLSYSSSEYINETSIFLQLGVEEPERCCHDCKSTQMVVLWLKTLNYYHVTALHEHTANVIQDINRFKASFKLRRRISTRLNMAAMLLESKQISFEEFDELRRVDHEYRRELIFEESGRLREALETIEDDMQMIIDLLLNPSITERGGRMAYYQIIKSILVLADEQPELIDFYWPQLIHVHFIESASKQSVSLMKVDLFQQMLLAIAQKYPSSLGLKLAWSLIATVNDYHSPPSIRRISQRQYAAAMSLLLQLELIVTGIVSAICDVPMSKLMSRILIPAAHQQQELAFELGILCLVRRKLQELYDEEEILRLKRNETRGLELAANASSTDLEAESSAPSSPAGAYKLKLVEDAYSQLPQDAFRKLSKRSDILTCVRLFLSLGVDQAPTPPPDDESADESSNLQPKAQLSKHWPAFAQQLDCFDSYTSIAEMLRFVDRPVRTQKLRSEIRRMMENGTISTLLGWDPTMPAGGPRYRIIKIEVDECRVFRTKARAPSLIICHVQRESTTTAASSHLTAASHHSTSHHHEHGGVSHSGSAPAINIDEVDGLVESNMSQAIADIQKLRLHNEQLPVAPSTSSASPPSLSRSKSANSLLLQSLTSQTPTSSHQMARVATATSSLPISDPAASSFNTNGGLTSSSKRASFVASHRKSVNFFSVLESVSSDDLPRTLTPSPHRPPPTPAPSSSSSAAATATARSVESPQPATDQEFLMEIVEAPIFPDPSIIKYLDHQHPPPSSASSSTAVAHPHNHHHPSVVNNLISSSSATNTALVTRKVFQSAQKLLLAGKINEQEYNELILSDFKYRHASAREEDQLMLSKVETSFGESWACKKDRLLGIYEDYLPSGSSASSASVEVADSPTNSNQAESSTTMQMGEDERIALASIKGRVSELDQYPRYDLRAYIIKSNDDLRQEMACLQIMELCAEIFEDLSISRYLYLRPYRIAAVSNSTGIVEVIPDTISLDALKKTAGFVSLSAYFHSTYGSSAERLLHAKRNFASSLAAYSLFCYILAIKDRHNGNILLDMHGHLIHIDFGFILSIAPGGSFSVETAPFKLTEEMVDVLGKALAISLPG
jgi:hypothetical protein